MNNINTRLFELADEESLRICADIIQAGGTVAFPTETVYGLGADALNDKAIEKIFIAKGRPNDNPLIMHIHDISLLEKYAKDIPQTAYTLAKLFMPGPLTLILKKRDIVPNAVSAGLDTVGIRIPNNEIARKLIEYSNTPIAAPSANISGKPSPTMYDHVVNDLYGKVDAIINGGMSDIGMESTVLDLTSSPPAILRPGGITFSQLQVVLADVERAYDSSVSTEAPKSPGMKYKHYAPAAKMVIVKAVDNASLSDVAKCINKNIKADEGVLCVRETFDMYKVKNKLCVGSINEPDNIAANIFLCLRLFDKMNVKKIYSEYFDIADIGEAVMNRLEKAAGGNIVHCSKQTNII